MPTTSNFGWNTPADTDLVKDGAAAIRTLGNNIDASLVDLKGGTTGQVLAKASNADLDYTWSNVDPLTILDAKGDLITATAADTPARLAVGTNGQYLQADSTTATGLKWATVSAGGITQLASGSLSGASVTISSISGSHKDLYLILRDWWPSVNNRQTGVQFNSDTGSNYFSEAGALLTEIRSLANQAATNGNAFSSFYIYDYADTTHHKSVVTVSNAVTSTPENQSATQAAFWLNSAAITSITIKLNADNFSGGTYILYGVS